MASFDPSIISQIPDYAGNPVEARAKAFKLEDMIQENQLRKYQLAQAKQGQQDEQTLRGILSKNDITTPEGRTAAASAAGKAGLTKPAMDIMKYSADQQLTDLQAKQIQLKFQAEEVGPAAAGLLTTLQTKGLPQMAAEYQQQIPALNARLQQMGIKPLPPQFPTNDPAQAEQILRAQIGHSETARSMLTEKRAEDTARRADERGARDEKRLDIAEAREARAQKQADDKAAGVLSPEDKQFMAQQYLAGDKSVFQNIGRGAQGAKNVIELRKAIREEAEKQGLKPQDVALKLAEFTGLMAEERSLGTRQAAIETAATEAQQVIPIALKASEAVPRGKFVPLNKLIQAGKVATSDPDLARFAQANLTLANVYARAISPTGVPTVSGREHALEVLGTATSQEAYRGVVDIMKQEIEAARKSPSMVRKDVRDSVGGNYEAPAPGPAAGSGVQPYADPEKEKRYQEWKKAHGGG